ncbi:MAG: pitrilysin family protein [Nanoarchaeota archaeon]|nr:pitrilysin family protein [Nanoarchaeota archaeon]
MNNDYNYREYTLENGLLVALQKTPLQIKTPKQTITGQLRFHHGSVHENPGEEGIAHFLEHNVTNGGSKKYSPEDIKKIRARFPIYNAGTSNSETMYTAGIFQEDLELFLDFFSNITFNPRLDNNIMELERQKVLREISDKKGRPDFRDRQILHESFFRNEFHGYFELGKEEVISNANEEILRRFHSRGYSPNNADLILVGALPKYVENLIEEYFSNIPIGLGKKFNFPQVNPLEKKVIIHSLAQDLQNKDNLEESNAEISVVFVVPHLRQKLYYPTALINSILRSGINSRLYKSINEKAGLACKIGNDYNGAENVGTMHISGHIHAKKKEPFLDILFKVLKNFRDNLIDYEELKTAKMRLRDKFARNLENNESLLDDVIQLKLDYNITIEDYFSNIARITRKDIREVAQKYFPNGREDENYVLLIRDPLKE